MRDEKVPDSNDTSDGLKLADRATLSLLSTLEEGEPVTQRSLASSIGVALGLTNSLLKRAIKKGLVKVQEAPTKRYAYYVTPKGFSEKSRLVADYLSSSLNFFRKAREQYADIYSKALANGHKRVLLYGTGELAEIAVLSAMDYDIKLEGVVQVGSNLETFSGLSVAGSIDAALVEAVDAVVITSTSTPQADFDILCEHFPVEQIYAVPLLHISCNGSGEEGGGQ